MDLTVSFVAVVLLLMINGFFVAAEFALVKARGFRIEGMASQGSAAARLTLRIQGNLEVYLAACQLGITMASLGLGWVGEPAVAAMLEPMFHSMGVPESLLHSTAFVVGFLLFSSLHIIVGEQVPKTFAIRQAEPVSIWVAYPLHLVYVISLPLNLLLNKATSSILSLFGVQEATHAEVLSGDEIKGLVATSKEHGEIQQEQADMLHNLFEFDQRQVGRVMIPRNAVSCLDVSESPDKTLAIMQDTEHSRFPVIDGSKDDHIVGILLARDIYRALLCGESEPWRELARFCREPLVVPEVQRVSQLFELMRQKRAHMAFVVDEYGSFVGVVTLEDLLEEIVGEIQDETDDEHPSFEIETVDERRWEADGLISLGDLQKTVGLVVPAELDANTLSGLFMERLACMPVAGDEVQEGEYRLRVLSITDRRVGRVSIEHVLAVTEPEVIAQAMESEPITNDSQQTEK